MTRISQLPATQFPSLGHEFPASYEGDTVKLTIAQLKTVLALTAMDVSFRGDDVETALASLFDNPPGDFGPEIQALSDRVPTRVYDYNLHYGS